MYGGTLQLVIYILFGNTLVFCNKWWASKDKKYISIENEILSFTYQDHSWTVCNLQKMLVDIYHHWLYHNQKTQATKGESASTSKLSCYLKKNVPEDNHFIKSALIYILYITHLGQITFLNCFIIFQFPSLVTYVVKRKDNRHSKNNF